MGDLALMKLLQHEGIRDARVLGAVGALDRASFIPPEQRSHATGNYPVPIGFEQTISQPYVVAYMTEALELQGTERVLEIGTGSGYQAAVLAQLVPEVYTVEILPTLAQRARATLEGMGLKNVVMRVGDGFEGCADAAPFDAIILTAAPRTLPPALLAQLKPGGRLLAPLGEVHKVQRLVRVRSNAQTQALTVEHLLAVQFVPMTGLAAGDGP